MASYDDLLQAYCEELREARDKALAWWDELVRRQLEAGMDREQAVKTLRRRWVVGPVSHPYVIAVFRKYFLLIEAKNEAAEAGAEQPIADANDEASWGETEPDGEEPILQPNEVLFENLEFEDRELAQFMQGLLLVPIGVDADGRSA